MLLRFDDALDAQKLHNGLTRLLNIGEWRKLGGRLRKNVRRRVRLCLKRYLHVRIRLIDAAVKVHGKLEVHISQEFTGERLS